MGWWLKSTFVFLLTCHYRLLPPVIGAVAQLGEHLLCKQGVSGSIPLSSTIPDVLKEASLVGDGNILREKIKFASARLSLMPVLITL
jgi:hypothetical protein